MRRTSNRVRVTLSEALVVATLTLVALAALRMGGVLAALFEFLALAIAIGVAVSAIVSGRAARTFAIGFFVAAAAYAGMLYWYGDAEFDPAKGRMLATRAFEPVYETVKREEYFDIFRHQYASEDELAILVNQPRQSPGALNLDVEQLGISASDRVARTQYQFFRVDEIPGRRDFMTVAHVLVGLLLGYAAGKFSVLLQRRRLDSSNADAAAREARESVDAAGAERRN